MRRAFRFGEVMRNHTACIVLTVLLAGCAVGPRVETFKPARSPAGVEASLDLTDGRLMQGELLAVEEPGLTLLIGNSVTQVPYARVRKASFAQTRIVIDQSKPWSAAVREELRLLSRFPQGLTPTLLTSLLAAYRQGELRVVP